MALQTLLFHNLLILSSLFPLLSLVNSQLKTYIVHVKKPNKVDDDNPLTSYHYSFLPPTVPNNSLIYSYKHVISGFSARLTSQQVKAMKKANDAFISAHVQTVYHPLTTRSPQFLGLNPRAGVWKQTGLGRGIIIGVVDTGIFPTHPSFSDHDMPCPPPTWNGACEPPVSCTRKIIAARSFSAGSDFSTYNESNPVDYTGHGTHTASTAAGGFVPNANVFGQAYGTAAGMAPNAHLAIYKACFNNDCLESNILAAMEAAIDDGVDILSLSLGSSKPFYKNILALGAYNAAKKGILVSSAAGNDGPAERTMLNEAPWMLTVGSSTIDRRILASARLGNGREFDGESVFQPKNFPGALLRVVYRAGPDGRQYCYNGSLAGIDVRGKVVLCDGSLRIYPVDQGKEVKKAGGAAMILANDEAQQFSHQSYALVLPATTVSYAAGLKIKAYVESESYPTTTILFKGTVLGGPFAPAVSYYSSRGPSKQTPGILKPDIIGPGENILAAWSPLGPPDNLGVIYKIFSGTSMSCPHLSGIAALVKSAHPNWSPAAIKSAIMTTADLVNAQGRPILDEKLTPADILAVGAGHVNLSRAIDPGLVYDIEMDDYIAYICGLGYTKEQVEIITQEPVDCTTRIKQGQLNYPTFSVLLGRSNTTFSRTVTNVGETVASYSVKIFAPPFVNIVVKPCKLYFTRLNQKATYQVTFSRSNTMIIWRNSSIVTQGTRTLNGVTWDEAARGLPAHESRWDCAWIARGCWWVTKDCACKAPVWTKTFPGKIQVLTG
ncbi:Subtilisin-like protease SBT1.2 [Striga hermonthica]|uniref:Subtilisin-like protease SBT1.2 n=1 Tax=Striga hermonthica TaxID=68872 RepID=A0A9N7RS22_STRHE|nr:Subtilisin-like protease SBT1.2 [Striga hermonthica]